MMQSPFIVAEVSANHLGSLERAHAIVEAAAKAGASAIKLQTFTPEQMVDADKVIETGPWAGRLAIDLYREAHTPREWHANLFTHAKMLGMVAFSSVFHPDDVEFLETIGCPIFKIASFEATDLALIERAADTGKPIIISTGMCTYKEIETAVELAKASGCMDVTALKCTSAYPAPIEEANLATIEGMRYDLEVDTGLSDHTMGHTAAVMAIALGAKVIEKHLTLSRQDGGLDAAFSAEPAEFAALVKACQEAAQALGRCQYGPTPSEAASMLLRRPPAGKRGGK